MPLIRRRNTREGPETRRITGWQVTLFFLAAGIWVVGVVAEDTRLTGAAIVLLVAALVLRIIRDRTARRDGSDNDGGTSVPRE